MALRRLVTCLAAAAAALALQGCAVAPHHPALAQAQAAGQLPPLLPVRRFVANIDFAGGYFLSPDGRQLMWSQAVGTDAGLAVRPVEGGQSRTFATGFLGRSAGPGATWLADSRHVMFTKDLRGDENTQLLVFDSQAGFDPWTVTPWPGVRSYFVAAGAPGSAKFFFASNRRDRTTMDLYEADAAARTVREVARSDGRVLGWLVGTNHELAARYRQLADADGSPGVFEVLQPDGSWRAVRHTGGWDYLTIHRIDTAAGKAWGFSNIGRDKSVLIELDVATGRETVLAEHPVVDLGWAFHARRGGGPVAVIADDGYPTIRYLDAQLGTGVQKAVASAMEQKLLDDAPRIVRPQSSSDDGQRWVLRALGDFEDAELFWDAGTGRVTRLDPREPERKAWLAAEQPYSFRASDGRTIHGYLIRPRGVTGPAPLVVEIHGGPWARETWSPAGFGVLQMLANRGYAVLTVNYRASTGYGREHMMAGAKVAFTRLQQDIAEAAQWAVDQGVADRERMAVLGASFGGYSVLAQLIRKDPDWRCGIDIVGVANWQRVIENWPPFWRNRHMFHTFFGDPAVPAEREKLLADSPVSHIDRITAPLLVIHGANDIRVLRQDSDDVVTRLQQLGRPVQYVSFPNEGHSVRRWRNRLEMWRRIEDQLATCLGGRSSGWDYYELMPK